MDEMPTTTDLLSDFMEPGSVRPFTMPQSRVECIQAKTLIITALFCIILAVGALLAWFALLPQDSAVASPSQGNVIASAVQAQLDDAHAEPSLKD